MSSSTQQPLPHAIASKLDEVRQVLRAYLWKTWVYRVMFVLLVVYWFGAAIDYLPVRVGADETPRAVRIGLLIAMALGTLWLLVGWLIPRLLRPITDSSLSLLIERHYPDLGNSLITAVQVSQSKVDVPDVNSHDQMFQRVLSDAKQKISQVQVEKLFHWRPLHVYRLLAIGGWLVTMAVALIAWPWLAHWNSRLFALNDQPWPRMASLRVDWLQLPLPTFTGQLSAQQITVHFNDQNLVRVPAGSSPRLQISADAAAPKLPEVCTLYYRSDDGPRGRANLRRLGAPKDGWQQFSLDGPPLDSVAADLSLDISGLDARLRNLQLQVIDPIVVTDLQLECHYPSYLLDSLSTRSERELLPYRIGMKIPEGTQCTLIGTCSGPLGLVEYLKLTAQASEPSALIDLQSATIQENRFSIPLGSLTESQLVEVRLSDQYGLPADQIVRYNIIVQQDSIPEVQSYLEGIGLAITGKAVLPIRGKAVDDHQIDSVLAELTLNEATLPSIPLTLNDQQLSGNVDLLELSKSYQINFASGLSLGLSVRADDRYDLDGKQHTGRGQPQQLSVVTEDQLLVILDRMELELRQRLEQIIIELKQLDEALQSMSEQLAQVQQLSKHQPARQQPARWLDNDPQRGLISMQVGGQSNDPQATAAENKLAEKQAMIRLAILRAQQGQLQSDKSRQELASVANRVENLRMQLINNRIDSVDRQQRLLQHVEQPLKTMLQNQYSELDRQMVRLQTAVSSDSGSLAATQSREALQQVMLALESIIDNMLDIESYNEIVDLVRGLLEDQERILKETEEAQKARILDLFK